MSGIAIEALGDSALLLRPAGRREYRWDSLHALGRDIAGQAPAWLVDVVVAERSLAVHLDPESASDPVARDAALDWLAQRLDAFAAERAEPEAPRPGIVVPVCYGGRYGPDLEAVAARLGLPPAELVARHGARSYRVVMLGFLPGFPYLDGLDPTLAVPRRATPRTRVAAGSVGIGGDRTGIYPNEGPGGWQLIGRTPLRLFDPDRSPPCRLEPGDVVHFEAIDAAAFERAARE